MTNQQQVNANRRNARKSTGPRTPGGRKRARMNALKHGMAAEEVVIPGEDPAELRASHRSFTAAWQPVGAIEAKLVWEITIADWRLRRARRLEPRLVEIGSARSENRGGFNSWMVETLGAAVSGGLSASTDRQFQSDELTEGKAGVRDAALSVAEMYFDSAGDLDAIRQLLRYEAAAERSYYRAFHTLERLQAKRMGKDVSPPQVMHVHGTE